MNKGARRVRAAREMDAIREEIFSKCSSADYDSAEMIRYWREARR